MRCSDQFCEAVRKRPTPASGEALGCLKISLPTTASSPENPVLREQRTSATLGNHIGHQRSISDVDCVGERYRKRMYEQIVQELVEPGTVRRFLGERTRCRYCGASGPGVFGKRSNAHTLPAALGNRTLFSLDECRACNDKFSLYEDALCKAVGPFLTLGGVRGRSGVRKTGKTGSAK